MWVAQAVSRANSDEVNEEAAVAPAIRRSEERLAKDPGSLAFAPLADLYRKAGRIPEAVQLCRDGLGRFPGYGTARLILAKALARVTVVELEMGHMGPITHPDAVNVEIERFLAQHHARP